MSTTTIPRPATASRDAERERGRLRSLLRGRVQDPAWARPALIALLMATASAYLWNLTASGDANGFYAAAVQAGTKSWKAFLFGSLDSSNFITVDKPPASLWVMELSGRLFGFSSASMLVPQVLEGVVAVGLLAAAVKRWFGAGAGLLAGALMAATPVAALMFRFNNPDALLVCLLVAAAYCLVRALENASTRWILATGGLLGFAFLAKMGQAFLVVPGFALAYALAAPVGARRRAGQLLAGGTAIAVSAGSWVALVALWPAASRPMIDGSPDNSILNLIVGYNGLGRLTGSGGGPGGPGTGGGGGGAGLSFSGATGPLRLFDDLMGAQASWLLPAALAVLVAGIVWRWRRPRTDRVRAALIVWGGWLVVSGVVFSFGSGVIHTYYTVALAPAIAALVAIGATTLWRHRDRPAARALLALGVASTAAWSIALLDRAASWQPWLSPLVGVSAAVAVACLLAPPSLWRRVAKVAVAAALVTCLAGPVAYSAQTIGTAHTGTVPSAGPATAGGFGHGGRPPGGSTAALPDGGPGSGSAAGGPPSVSRTSGASARGGFPAGGGGGMPGSTQASQALVTALKDGASGYRWAAATSGSQSAASLELASGGAPVMAIGGFSNEGGNITWPGSRPTSRPARSTTTSPPAPVACRPGPAAGRARARSAAGSRPTSRRRRSGDRRSTTSAARSRRDPRDRRRAGG